MVDSPDKAEKMHFHQGVNAGLIIGAVVSLADPFFALIALGISVAVYVYKGY